MADAVEATRLLVGAIFVIAGVTKMLRRPQFEVTLHLWGLSPRAVQLVAFSLPPSEFAVGLLVATGFAWPLGPWLAGLLLVTFTAAAWLLVHHGRVAPCGCFGFVDGAVDFGLVARNAVLASYVGVLVVGSHHVGPPTAALSGISVLTLVDLVGLALLPFVVGATISAWNAANRLVDVTQLAASHRVVEDAR